MSNEEMAIKIYEDGNSPKEVISSLWNNVYKLAWRMVNKFFIAYGDTYERAGITPEDLFQECFFAMLRAVQDYGKSKRNYKFNTFFTWHIKSTLGRCFGRKSEALRYCKSIDEPVPGTDDLTVGDTVEDKAAAETAERVDELLAMRGLFGDIKQALEDEPQLFEIIDRHYRKNENLINIAKEKGCSTENIRAKKAKALRKLRSARRLLQGYADVIDMSFGRNGLQHWKRTGNSSVEWAVLKFDTVMHMRDTDYLAAARNSDTAADI